MADVFLFRLFKIVFRAGGGRKQNLYQMKWPSGARVFKFCAFLVHVLLAKCLNLLLTFMAFFLHRLAFQDFLNVWFD